MSIFVPLRAKFCEEKAAEEEKMKKRAHTVENERSERGEKRYTHLHMDGVLCVFISTLSVYVAREKIILLNKQKQTCMKKLKRGGRERDK